MPDILSSNIEDILNLSIFRGSGYSVWLLSPSCVPVSKDSVLSNAKYIVDLGSVGFTFIVNNRDVIFIARDDEDNAYMCVRTLIYLNISIRDIIRKVQYTGIYKCVPIQCKDCDSLKLSKYRVFSIVDDSMFDDIDPFDRMMVNYNIDKGWPILVCFDIIVSGAKNE